MTETPAVGGVSLLVTIPMQRASYWFLCQWQKRPADILHGCHDGTVKKFIKKNNLIYQLKQKTTKML